MIALSNVTESVSPRVGAQENAIAVRDGSDSISSTRNTGRSPGIVAVSARRNQFVPQPQNTSETQPPPGKAQNAAIDSPAPKTADPQVQAQQNEQARQRAEEELENARIRREILENLQQGNRVSSSATKSSTPPQAGAASSGASEEAQRQAESRQVENQKQEVQEAAARSQREERLRKELLKLIEEGKPVTNGELLQKASENESAKALARSEVQREEDRKESQKAVFEDVQQRLADIFSTQSGIAFLGKHADLRA